MNKEKNNHICPVEKSGGLDNSFRKLLHNLKKVLYPCIQEGMLDKVKQPITITILISLISVMTFGQVTFDEPDSLNLVYIKDLTKINEQYFIHIDYIQWLTGNTAKNAAREDGDNDCCPNGYYIRNQIQKTERFQIADSVKIGLITGLGYVHDPKIFSLPEFYDIINNRNEYGQWLPYRIYLKDKMVVTISEWYIP